TRLPSAAAAALEVVSTTALIVAPALRNVSVVSERARLRLERLDSERAGAHRLVVEAVAVGIPQRVLEPVHVVALGEVAVRVGAAALLARRCRRDRRLRDLDQVVEFERLHARGVENLRLVLQAHRFYAPGEVEDAPDPLVEQFLRA